MTPNVSIPYDEFLEAEIQCCARTANLSCAEVQDRHRIGHKIVEFRVVGSRPFCAQPGITREMSMTKALVVMVAALSFGFAGAALAAGAPSKSGGSTASSSKASSSKASSQGSPAASKGAAKGALNANGPSLDGFDGELVIFAKSDRVILQGEASPAR